MRGFGKRVGGGVLFFLVNFEPTKFWGLRPVHTWEIKRSCKSRHEDVREINIKWVQFLPSFCSLVYLSVVWVPRFHGKPFYLLPGHYAIGRPFSSQVSSTPFETFLACSESGQSLCGSVGITSLPSVHTPVGTLVDRGKVEHSRGVLFIFTCSGHTGKELRKTRTNK